MWCVVCCFFFFLLFFSFIFLNWRLITLQYCGFFHTLTWISHGFTCDPHPKIVKDKQNVMTTCGFQRLIYLPSGKIHVNPPLDTYSTSLEITESETNIPFFCNFQKKRVFKFQHVSEQRWWTQFHTVKTNALGLLYNNPCDLEKDKEGDCEIRFRI